MTGLPLVSAHDSLRTHILMSEAEYFNPQYLRTTAAKLTGARHGGLLDCQLMPCAALHFM